MEPGGCTNGKKGNRGKHQNGVSEVYGRKIKFVTIVTHVTNQNAIVYPELKADSWRLGTLFDYTYLLLRYPHPCLVLQPGGGFGWQLPIANSCSAVPRLRTISRGRAVWQARRVHTPKVAGSNPAFAIYLV